MTPQARNWSLVRDVLTETFPFWIFFTGKPAIKNLSLVKNSIKTRRKLNNILRFKIKTHGVILEKQVKPVEITWTFANEKSKSRSWTNKTIRIQRQIFRFSHKTAYLNIFKKQWSLMKRWDVSSILRKIYNCIVFDYRLLFLYFFVVVV